MSWQTYLNLTEAQEHRCFAPARASFSPIPFLLLFCSEEELIRVIRGVEKNHTGESHQGLEEVTGVGGYFRGARGHMGGRIE